MPTLLKRNRIVIIGAGGVGKTAMLMRFLFGTCPLDHKETVEDLYCREYTLQDRKVNIDFLDTSGSIAFPAMRRLAISKAQAFILVYSVNSEASFEEMKVIWNQIREHRADSVDQLPCVVVGNKSDLDNYRQVETFSGMNWAFSEGLQAVFIEVSGRFNYKIKEIFQVLFNQFTAPRETVDVNFTFIARRFGNVDPPLYNKRKRTIAMQWFKRRTSLQNGGHDDIADIVCT